MIFTTKQIRKTNKANKEPCFACGGHKSIAQSHHVLPLKYCMMMLNTNAISEIETPLIWLCPNCHAHLHQMLTGRFYLARPEVSKEVYDALLLIFQECSKRFSNAIDGVMSHE
jgi:ssDNA-binding Zn-finger/Zn-ribbon topoisomerase 1